MSGESGAEGVSLADELAVLIGVVGAVQAMLEPSAALQGPRATLALLESRLRLVRLVVLGAAPGVALLACHNHRREVSAHEDADVVLPLSAPRAAGRGRR